MQLIYFTLTIIFQSLAVFLAVQTTKRLQWKVLNPASLTILVSFIMIISNLYVYFRSFSGSLDRFLLVARSDTSMLLAHTLYISCFCCFLIFALCIFPTVLIPKLRIKMISIKITLPPKLILKLLVALVLVLTTFLYINSSLAGRSYSDYLAARQVAKAGNIQRVFFSYLNSALFLLPVVLSISRKKIDYLYLLLTCVVYALVGGRSKVLIVVLIALTVHYNIKLTRSYLLISFQWLRLKFSMYKKFLVVIGAFIILLILTIVRSLHNTESGFLLIIDSLMISQGRSLQTILGTEYLGKQLFEFSLSNIFFTGLTPVLKHIIPNFPELYTIGSLIGKELQYGWIRNSSFFVGLQGELLLLAVSTHLPPFLFSSFLVTVLIMVKSIWTRLERESARAHSDLLSSPTFTGSINTYNIFQIDQAVLLWCIIYPVLNGGITYMFDLSLIVSLTTYWLFWRKLF